MAASAQWSQSPAPPPDVRAMTYDEDRGRLVAVALHPTPGLLRTWEFDGSSWLQVSATTPQAYSSSPEYYSLVYDTLRRRVLLVLAADYSGGAVAVRSYDGSAWTAHSSPGVPRGRSECTAAFDEARGRLIVYNDDGLFEWDGAVWYRPQPIVSPPLRYGAAIAYDKLRRVTVVDGGFIARFTYDPFAWEWDGVQWRSAGTGIQRHQHRMAYDHARQSVVAFGGLWISSDGNLLLQKAHPVEWRGAAWQALVGGPSHTPFPVMAHDLGRARLIVAAPFAGSAFELGLPNAATYAPLGSGCAGPAALVLSGGQLAWVGRSFDQALLSAPASAASAVLLVGGSRTQWGALPLPLDLTSLGMTGCRLRTSVDMVLPFALAGGRGIVSIPIPSSPWLVGARMYDQCSVPDSAANPLGVVLSNAREWVIGG
ncbi:MAG: hypothetical protein R3F56_26185 [Planctomycetota bacterium]